VDDVNAHWAKVEALLAHVVERVGDELKSGAERDAVVARFTEWEEARQNDSGLDADACARYAGIGPIGMSVDGLIRYWRKRL